MPINATDKSICRYCRLKEPDVEIRTVKGLPIGECKACNRNRQSAQRLQRSFHLGLYQALPDLVAANLKMLYALQPGAYPILYRLTQERVGFIVPTARSIYIALHGERTLYRHDLFGIASFLGNQNLFIGRDAITLLDEARAPIELESIGEGLETKDVAERLIWLDKALLDRAVALVRSEATKAKRLNVAMALMAKQAKA